jgi:hypothetical protein
MATTCSEQLVETVYHNEKEGRNFKTVPVCIYCVETGSEDFLYEQSQLKSCLQDKAEVLSSRQKEITLRRKWYSSIH